MGLFTSTEKKIANAVVGAFTKVESEIQQIEQVVLGDVKGAFEKAHSDAVAANKEVTELKAQLQEALARATKLHQLAIDAAAAAQASAEAEVARFKSLVVAHTADLATQASQIITPAPAPVTDTPTPPAVTFTPASEMAPVVDIPTSGTPA